MSEFPQFHKSLPARQLWRSWDVHKWIHSDKTLHRTCPIWNCPNFLNENEFIIMSPNTSPNNSFYNQPFAGYNGFTKYWMQKYSQYASRYLCESSVFNLLPNECYSRGDWENTEGHHQWEKIIGVSITTTENKSQSGWNVPKEKLWEVKNPLSHLSDDDIQDPLV